MLETEMIFKVVDENTGEVSIKHGIFNQAPYTETSTFAQYESCKKYHSTRVYRYIGLKDKNGKMIFIGDKYKYSHLPTIYTVDELAVAYWLIDTDKMNEPMNNIELVEG